MKPVIQTPQPVAKESIVRVMVPRAIPSMLDYRFRDTRPPTVGQLVSIPVGKQACHGMVTEVLTHSPFQNLKAAEPLADVPPLAATTAAFYRWMARYTLSAPGDPLRAALPKGQVPPQPPAPVVYGIGETTKLKLTPQRQAVLGAAITPQSPADLARSAGVSAGVVKSLIDAGALKAQTVAATPPPTPKLAKLTEAQAAATASLQEAVRAEKFRVFLLDGVTGSGKTEVYFHTLADLLATNPTAQALVLVPEIALTPQWLQRFKDQFGFTPVVWHANITDAQRHRAWWHVHHGTARVVVGARSALFLPFRNLKLAVIDEEHDPSYKQDDMFRYHGRDMAVALAQHWHCPAVLASATPGLETWQNVLNRKYTRLVLPQRHGNQTLPPIQLIDLKQEKLAKDSFLSASVQTALTETLARKEQALVFLNRRGNAPLLLCTACGYRRDCPSCDATLTVHGDKLQCHHCGLTEPWPETCPQCQAEDSWRLYGPGTRRLVQEVQEAFPAARIAIADSDAVHTPAQQRELVQQIQDHQVDIIIGTQMMAKGHHFPTLTLAAVIDGDMGLAHGDVRAAERTFQLLTQVAGRAGRGETPGRVLVQTYQPEQPLFQHLKNYDRDAFYTHELALRQEWADPPFGRQIALILDGLDEQLVKKSAETLAQAAPKNNHILVLGPAPAPLAKLRDRYRYRLLVKGAVPLQKYVKDWLENTALPQRIRVIVDVDPHSYS